MKERINNAAPNNSMDVRAKQRLCQKRYLFFLTLCGGGFAPRHLNRSTASFEINVRIFKRQFLFFLIFLIGNLSIVAQEKLPFANAVTVSYCELLREPAKYDKQIVRVRADYFVAFEVSRFSDSACENRENDAWVEFDSSVKGSTNRKVLKRFQDLTSAAGIKSKNGGVEFGAGRANILIVGRFDGIKRKETIKTPTETVTLSYGFGHMNGYNYRLTVLAIEDAKPISEKNRGK